MHLRPLYWMATVAVAVTLLAWWLWPHGAEAPAASAAPTADAQGRVRLTPEQERNLGIRTERSRAATDVPVTGLPAEAMPPLATSSQVTVPFAGVVTRVLVDEGGFYPANTDTSVKPHDGAGGVSCSRESVIARSSSARRSV